VAALRVPDKLAVCVCERVILNDAVAVTEAVAFALRVAVPERVRVLVCERVPDVVGLADADPLSEGLDDDDDEPLTLADWLCERVAETLCDGDADVVALTLCEADGDADAVLESVGEPEGLNDALDDCVGVTLGVSAWLGVTLGVGEHSVFTALSSTAKNWLSGDQVAPPSAVPTAPAAVPEPSSGAW